MNFGILGPVEVTTDEGDLVRLGKRMDRCLLTVLLLQPRQVVSTDSLVDALWPDGPPARPDTSLHSTVARLRRSLEPDRPAGKPSTRVLRRSPGYLLDVSDDEVDAGRFEHAAAEGRRLLEAGDLVRSAAQFRRALAEWRGRALGEFAGAPFAVGEAERLEDLRLTTVEDDLSVRLALGERGLVAGIEALVASNPLRERLWETLIVALYREGRQAEALRRAQELREVLADIGLEPSPPLHQLEAAVLRHDPRLLEEGPGGLRPPRRSVPPAAAAGAASDWPRWTQRSGDFVGRAEELERIAVSWQAAVDGAVLLTVLTGEPGIGKSWLAIEAATRAAGGDAAVIAGRCSPEPVVPYEPFVEALTRLLDRLEDSELATLGEHLERLAVILPLRASRLRALGDRAPARVAAPTDLDRYLLFEAVGSLLTLATGTAPLVVLLDDLQWADPSTLRLLEHLLRSESLHRVLVLATVRDTDLERGGPLRAQLDRLAREQVATMVPLRGFTTDDIDRVVATRHAEGDHRRLVTELHAATGGNPFFVVEVLRSLDGEASVPAEGFAVPTSAQALIRTRLEQLGDEERDRLVTAALIHRRVDVDLVARVAGRTAAEVTSGLEAARRAGLVEPRGDVLAFRHDLVRAELAKSIGPLALAARHRAIADAMSTRAGDDLAPIVDVLAGHYAAAASDGSYAEAVRFARLAATAASDRFAYDTAVSRLEAGLAALTRSGATDRRCELELLLELSEAWRRAGEQDRCHDAGARALPLALEIGTPREQRAAAWATAQGSTLHTGVQRNALTGAMAEVHRRLTADPEATDDDRALVALALAGEAWVDGDLPRAIELTRQAMDLSLAATEPSTVVVVIDHALILFGERESIEARLAMVDRLLEAATASGDLETELLAQSNARWVNLTAGNVGRAREHAARYEALAEHLGMPRYLAGVAQRRAMQAILSGQFAEAESFADEVLAHRPDAEFFEGYTAQLAMVCIEQGRHRDLAALMEMVEDRGTPAWEAARALVSVELGRAEEAAEALDRVVSRLEVLEPDINWLVTLSLAGRAAYEMGDARSGAVLLEWLLPYAGRVATGGAAAVSLGPISVLLGQLSGLVGDLGAAECWFAESDRLLDALDADAVRSRRDLVHGELLFRLGGPERTGDAAEVLQRGLSEAGRLGLGGAIVARAGALLDSHRRAGTRPTGG